MSRTGNPFYTLLPALTCLLLLAARTDAQPKYTIRPLGERPDAFDIRPTAINEHGIVVAHGELLRKNPRTGYPERAYVSRVFVLAGKDPLAPVEPAAPPPPAPPARDEDKQESFAYAVNDHGLVVGKRVYWATVWRDGRPTTLPATVNDERVTGEAYGINNHGLVVGETALPGRGTRRACLWRDGTFATLDLPTGCRESRATAVNEAGRVVGIGFTILENHPDSRARAFAWEAGRLTDLHPPAGYADTAAMAVSDRGLIVGWAGVDGPLRVRRRAVVWRDGAMQDLGDLPGVDLERAVVSLTARAVNNADDVVGGASVLSGCVVSSVAWLYHDGRMYRLADLIPPDSGWTLANATGINDRGQIVGEGYLARRAAGFVLDPVPAPSTRPAAKHAPRP